MVTKVLNWINYRLPIINTFERHLSKHPVPKKVNFWYLFGALASIVLILQIVTGIWLMMPYSNTEEGAFASIEYIMRDVDYGWIIRYMHTTGASMFFAIVYLHMFRGLLYGSYKKPKELVWIFGCTIYLVMMAEGFLGYVLPYGQMSYWGAQVIISLFGAIPYIGESLEVWIRGDYYISGITISRFFALHVVLLPLLLVALVFVHIVALHHVGSNNPDGIEIKKKKDNQGIPLDGIPFWPYSIVKDLFALSVFLFIFLAIVFFAPEMGGYFIEIPNFEKANPLKTPEHIAPVWYYTPFYAMLRAATFPLFGMSAKFWGLVVMVSAIAIPLALPWLDKSPVKSIRYKGVLSRWALRLFVVSFFVLGWLGVMPATKTYTIMAQFFTLIYFAYFVLMPWYTTVEATRPEPERVT